MEEYNSLLRETIRGARISSLFFGYGSDNVENYLESQEQELISLKNTAHCNGNKLNTRKTLDLEYKLFELNVSTQLSRLN